MNTVEDLQDDISAEEGADLSDLSSLKTKEYENHKGIAYKTTEMFAGICKRKLWLKASQNGEAATNGHLIQIDFNHPDHYLHLEHEIAHILFRSDFLAKKCFVETYGKMVSDVAQKHGVPMDLTGLSYTLGAIINILEDRRVNSLWGLIYEGSGARLQQILTHDTEPHVARAYESLVTFMVCLLGGHVFPTSHPFSRFQGMVLDALEQVEKRGFASTLAVTKRLVSRLVDEIIRENQGLPPLPMPMAGDPDPQGQQNQQSGDGSGQGGQGQDQNYKDQQGQDPRNQQGPQQNPSAGGNKPTDDAGQGAGSAHQGTGSEEGADRPQASAADRSKALAQLMSKAGKLPSHLDKKLDDFQEPKFPTRDARGDAQKAAQKAIRANINDDDAFGILLAQDRDDMFQVVFDARKAMGRAMSRNDFLTQGAMAKVTFTDLPATKAPEPLEPEDQDTVRRLRAIFNRVLGKKRLSLEDAGTEVDVNALIERRITGLPNPVFRHEVSGRGFRVKLLLDQSGSMDGAKMQQANRACRVLSKALRFPFVDQSVWGFASTNNGEVTIDRFHKDTDFFGGAKNSLTPLHTAIRVARRELETSKDVKQLVVITDGQPTYGSGKGWFNSSTLQTFIRSEVRSMRQRGINVTGVVIGGDMRDHELSYMFWNPRHWKRVTTSTFGSDLIGLVSASFLTYLKNL